MIDPSIKLISIVGPTASGKTDLAIELAERFSGEIICADSRTIYRGMDIGTAKPTAEDQARVPHHLLDLIDPPVSYSAQEFQQVAYTVMTDIDARGRMPFLVGGTGLYAYAVAYGYHFPAGIRTDLRVELEALPLDELVKQLEEKDPERAAEIDLKNPRRVIRALETVGQPRSRRAELPANVLLLGLRPVIEALNQKIVQRTKHMLQIGLVNEVQKILENYGPDIEVLRSPGYVEIVDYLQGKTDLARAEELINLHTLQLVKKQLTWYRRNPDIQWLREPGEAESLVRAFLGR